MNLTYRHTKIAAYIGYITQAIVNNLTPLLFVRFSEEFGLSLEKISLLITVNFGVQILTDILSAGYVMKLGYRRACVLSHILSAAGLFLYGVLPFVMNSFAGLCIASVFCAVGGGLDEVIISPVMEALPGDDKSSDMSLLHSFYCWGQMGVVLISTLFFTIFGIDNWRYVTFIWAVIPALNALFFGFVPIKELEAGEENTGFGRLLKNKIFWLLMALMLCAGASELAMSQWASLFAEEGLGVSKTLGDLLGPCMFACCMGISRVIYGMKYEKISLEKFMIFSGILCIAAYLAAALCPNPILALLGCGVCGFSVGIMWPGTYSLGAGELPCGGTRMFALLALAGDIGCTTGPDLVGLLAGNNQNIRKGLGFAIMFPIVLVISTLLLKNRKGKAANE